MLIPVHFSDCYYISLTELYLDMSQERNALMSKAYPKLKAYCKERHGLEFQVVDMRWGVQNTARDDHSTNELCMDEIRNSQLHSVGPNFVVSYAEHDMGLVIYNYKDGLQE